MIACSEGSLFSNGNSFGNGASMCAGGNRNLEPWFIRLLRPLQDRGSV